MLDINDSIIRGYTHLLIEEATGSDFSDFIFDKKVCVTTRDDASTLVTIDFVCRNNNTRLKYSFDIHNMKAIGFEAFEKYYAKSFFHTGIIEVDYIVIPKIETIRQMYEMKNIRIIA